MNVVVIVAHGLNCHWLGPYGNEWVNTPTVDALACESVVFDRHFANIPSPAGFLNSCPLLAEQRAGAYAAFLDDRKQQPIDDRPWDVVTRTDPGAFRTPGEALLAALKSILGKLPNIRPWLLWIETDRLIPPWDFEFETYQQYAEESGGFIEERPTAHEEPIDEPATGPIATDDDSMWHRLHNSFAAAVTSFDAELAAIIKELRTRGLDRSAAWMITSGYGFPLGEHGIVGPKGSRLHEELVHVPLIVRLPEGREALRRVSTFTQTSDLMPTIAELIGVSGSKQSLAPLMTGPAIAGRDLCRLRSDCNGGLERGLRTGDCAFLPATSGGPARLYQKPDDIWEVNDLAPRSADECDRLTAILDEKEPNP